MTYIDDSMIALTLAMTRPSSPGATLTLAWDDNGTAPRRTATIGCRPIEEDDADRLAAFIREHTDDDDPDQTARGFTHLWETGQYLRAVESLTPIGITVTLGTGVDLTAHHEDQYGHPWEGWDDRSIDTMIADIGQKAAALVAATSWHQYNLLDGPEPPSDSRRICIGLIDDLRGLLDRDATAR